MKKLVVLTLLIVITLLSTDVVHAQTAFPGTVIRIPSEEPYMDVKLDPGQAYGSSFIVQHQYEDPAKVVLLYVNASDFEIDTTTGNTVYPKGSFKFDSKTSMVDWIAFNQTQFKMDHFGQETEIKFTVQVPRTALPGTYYANILVSNADPDTQLGKQKVAGFEGAGVVSRLVAASVIVTVNGEREQSVRITSLKVRDPLDGEGLLGLFHNLAPVTVVATIENKGNQLLLPGGDLFIHTGDNANPVMHIPLNANRVRVLPDTTHEFTATWKDGFLTASDAGNVQIDITKVAELNWGRYFAEVDLLYKTLDGRLEKVTTVIPFWILPWRYVLMLVVFIVVAGLVITYYKKTQVKLLPNPLTKTRGKRRQFRTSSSLPTTSPD